MPDAIIATGKAPWIPVPHRMELLREASYPGERSLITAAFVLVFDVDDRLLLTHVNLPGRSWDVPGGHIDPGEDAASAATRELAEETGFAVDPGRLSLVGWQRFTLLRLPPATYAYPYPLSYTLMFAARTTQRAPRVAPSPDSECGPAGWFTIAEVGERCPGVSWLPFVASTLTDPPTGLDR